MLSKDATQTVRTRLDYIRHNRDELIIDGDVHPTGRSMLSPQMSERITDPNYFHGRPLLSEDLLSAMDLAQIDMALCWQNPSTLSYIEDGAENFRRLLGANEAIAKLGRDNFERVIPGGWTDPKALGTDRAIEMAELCVGTFGMPIVKMNPAQNGYPIDDPMVFAVVERIVDLGAVPAFHFGSDTPYTPPDGLEHLAARHPDHPIIAVHMGGGGGHFIEAEATYQAARQLGFRRPNLFFILSAIRDPHIASALISYADAGEPFSRNLAIGSDAPYGNMLWNLGGFRALFEGLAQGLSYGDPRLAAKPDLFDARTISDFMGGNLADLVIAADSRLLSRSD